MIGPILARLRLPPPMSIYTVSHVSLLKPCEQGPEHLRRGSQTQLPVGPDEYVVEEILDHKETRQGPKSPVRWLGGSTTWQPQSNLTNARDLVRRYHRGRKAQQRQGRNSS
ncbi:retrotransposable element tf2 155 kda protein type 1 [Cystoisospora suis]|uniref:Retrotransposable element tf2 155 kDa protein type 1 n=1 Tax=Cystoisospora suis TaxID=483139 RepID=A0A2C6KFU6_9APIC|nr:retrotransposable element tf2 155 kda protein type 1 [Cystoisospora suis]